MPRTNHPITRQDASRALCLDFEGPGRSRDDDDPLPIFAGVLCEGVYEGTVLDERLFAVASDRELNRLSVDEFLDSLLERARTQRRRIVFWTSHEEELFQGRGYPLNAIGFDVKIDAKDRQELRPRFRQFNEDKRRFRDPNTARTTRNALRPCAFGLLTLITQEIGLDRPSSYGAGLVGKWIRMMLNQAETRPSYARWSNGGKGSFTKLINHNKHDCRATQYLLEYLLDG